MTDGITVIEKDRIYRQKHLGRILGRRRGRK
jgi:hypothetical protein